ncbi:MAG: hypothetical protein WKF51_11560, partial [Geodermatophilaceae bacterium]
MTRLQPVVDDDPWSAASQDPYVDVPPPNEPPGEPAAPDAPRSWRPIDLEPVLSGTFTPVVPTVGRRDDGTSVFYPARIHSVASESEAGKTWFALTAIATELSAGHAAIYLDFEDDEGGVVGRLLALHVAPDTIRARFAYIRPEDSVLAGINRHDLGQALGDHKPTLVVLDGVTEAMTVHGMDPLSNQDVARFGKLLPRNIEPPRVQWRASSPGSGC